MTSQASEYWSDTPEDELSQGDVLEEVLFGVAEYPPCELRKQTVKKHGDVWVPYSKPCGDRYFNWLGRGRLAMALVISHSCDLDKREGKNRVIVAPVARASSIEPRHWENIRAYGRRALFPLPSVPSIGDAYSDLRQLTTVDRAFLEKARKLCSMSEDGLKLLQRHLVGFLVRG